MPRKYQDEFAKLPVAQQGLSTDRTETLLYECPRCKRLFPTQGVCNRCKSQMENPEIENIEAE